MRDDSSNHDPPFEDPSSCREMNETSSTLLYFNATDDPRKQEDRRAGPVLRRPGDDQRPLLVARRPENRVRDLPVGPAERQVVTHGQGVLVFSRARNPARIDQPGTPSEAITIETEDDASFLSVQGIVSVEWLVDAARCDQRRSPGGPGHEPAHPSPSRAPRAGAASSCPPRSSLAPRSATSSSISMARFR